MHVTTFYSFKGGVGRTQALVNVGVELALRGRRVLLVDCDLEAPGIDTYPLPKPIDTAPGMVEFVNEYMATGESPDASRYMYECPGVGRKGGRLWVMPAGQQDESYARRLHDIDWRDLYAEKSGYLLFEDLKEQWRQTLAPDYVLIDSRTGHSDVSGICTRQLPDSVVILFFPTDQNLRGLPKVVHDIRAEAEGPREKAINLLFVMSNVPDLDDEDQILENRIRLFADTLGYRTLSATIHRYDSLALLNQVIFTADHPKSRLAKEYHALADSIIEQNLDDREGALAFIKAVTRRRGSSIATLSRTDIESRLTAIRRDHASDVDILGGLADLRMSEGRFDEADSLWTAIVELTAPTPHVLLHRAEARTILGNRDGALADVESLLKEPGAADFEVARALSVLSASAPARLRDVANAPAIRNLEAEGKLWVADQLARDHDGLSAARDILRQLIGPATVATSVQEHARHQLTLVMMGLGQIEDALKLLDESPTRDSSVNESFNYAMARWAAEGTPQDTLFERVLALDHDNGSPNYAECLALTHAVLDQSDAAQQRLNQARQRLASRPEPQFSCWRYRVVSADEFLEDLDDIRRFVSDRSVRPRFIDYAPSHSR